MSNRNSKSNVSHSLTSHLFLSNFYTATVTNNTSISYSFVFTAMTFVIFVGTEDAFAEQTVSFGFVCTIVDGFGFENLTRRFF
ncbi:hypothetical protein SDC9_101666 [bioreactor metagenome]|uniref:Uncharacterized protein n=1 Tax=bioreactor metagenome TaxID=1076179 RepID=A0A645AVE8_9ZZZZ